MGFRFITTDKKVNQSIIWKFENHPTSYQSEQARFERNVEFWRAKLGLPSTERVFTLNGDFEPIEYTEFEEIAVEPEYTLFEEIVDESPVEYVNPIELKEETNDEPTKLPIDSHDDLESDVQPSVSKNTKDIIDTPKRKSRRKAV